MTRTEILANYEVAIETHNAAVAVYNEVLSAYRAMTIGHDEYLAARAIKVAADAAFDAAFALVADLPEEEEVEAFEDAQLALFA